MKKIAYFSVIAAIGLVCFASCNKDYSCTCTYNNTVVYNEDLGKQSLRDAKDMCSRHDSTTPGEVWLCKAH